MNKQAPRLTWPEWVFLAALALLPVVHSLALFRFFTTPQLAVLVAAMGALIIPALRGSRRWLRSETSVVRWSVGLLVVFLIWMAVSAVVGEDPTRSWAGHTFQGTGAVMWIAACVLFVTGARLSDAARTMATKALGVTAMVLIVLTGFWAVFPSVMETTLVPRQQDGVPLPGVGNAVMLAAVYGVCALLMIGSWVTAGKRSGLVIAFLSIGLAMLSQSRVAAAATIILIVIGCGIAARNKEQRSRAVLAVVATVIAVLIGQIALQPLVRTGMGLADAVGAGRAGRFSPAEVSAGLRSRLVFWQVASRSIAAEPFLGVGPANFTYPYRRLATDADVEGSGVGNVEVNDAHNLFIEVAATMGVPAAVLLLAFVLLLFIGHLKRGWRSISDPDAMWRSFAIGVLLAVAMFQSLNLVTLPLLAALAGISVSTGKAQMSRVTGPGVVATGLFSALGLIVAGSLVWSDKLLLVGSNEWDATKLTTASSLNPTCQVCLYELGKVRRWDLKKERQGSFEDAMSPNLEAVRRHPSDAEARVQLAGGYLFLNRPASAIAPLRAAIGMNQRSLLAVHALAVAYLRLERYDSAVPHLQRVAELNPSGKTLGLLAFAADKAGKAEIASQARRKSLELDPSGDSLYDSEEVNEGG